MRASAINAADIYLEIPVEKMRNRRGFTLIEILIVVIILGILAAIVIPQFRTPAQAKAGDLPAGQYPLSQIDTDAVTRDGVTFASQTDKGRADGKTAGQNATLEQTATINNPSDEIESRSSRSDDSK